MFRYQYKRVPFAKKYFIFDIETQQKVGEISDEKVIDILDSFVPSERSMIRYIDQQGDKVIIYSITALPSLAGKNVKMSSDSGYVKYEISFKTTTNITSKEESQSTKEQKSTEQESKPRRRRGRPKKNK